MVIITQEAIEDVATFYANTLLAYPNTWTQEDVDKQIEITIKQMESVTIESINGQRTPLLQELNDGNTIELKTKNGKWYFSVRFEMGNTLIENAWYCTNASNRAFRRGGSTPNAPLTQDDRVNQTRQKITEFQLRSIIRETLRRVLLTA